MTIEIGDHDVFINVTHDIDGQIGTIEVNEKGVLVNGQFVPWSV